MDSVSSSSASLPRESAEYGTPGSRPDGHSSSFGGRGSPVPGSAAPQIPSPPPSPAAGSPIMSRRPSVDGSVGSTNPSGTSGLRPPSANQSVPDADLDNMGLPELSQEGNRRLDAAKTAYTKYAEINIAQQAQQALQSFIGACTDNSDNRLAMINALKAIKLPNSAPTDLSVTIKFPGQPSMSLIPPEEKQLKEASTENITLWYRMAEEAMSNWSQQNAQSANALASAKRLLDDAVASLKAVRETIDRKTHERTQRPGQSQLEVEYQRFVDQGVTIHFDSSAEAVAAKGTPNPAPANIPGPLPQQPTAA